MRQLHRAAHALRDVDEGAVAEDRAVQRREVIVVLRHDLAEPLADEIGIFADRLADRAEDDARALPAPRGRWSRPRRCRTPRRPRRGAAACRPRPRRASSAPRSGCRASRRRAGSRDRPRPASPASASPWARRNNRRPDNRSAGRSSLAQSGASIVCHSANAFSRQSSIHCGSFFLAEMKRTVSSLSPLGAKSCSMSGRKAPFVRLGRRRHRPRRSWWPLCGHLRRASRAARATRGSPRRARRAPRR